MLPETRFLSRHILAVSLGPAIGLKVSFVNLSDMCRGQNVTRNTIPIETPFGIRHIILLQHLMLESSLRLIQGMVHVRRYDGDTRKQTKTQERIWKHKNTNTRTNKSTRKKQNKNNGNDKDNLGQGLGPFCV